MVTKTAFGSCGAGAVTCVLLRDETGAEAEFLTLGAALRALRVPDRDGAPRDVVLGYDTAEAYFRHDGCLGGTIGRCANRIGGASFSLDGQTFLLSANEGPNQLHGGWEGFHKKLWDLASAGEDTVVFTRTSPHGEEGYPGTLRAEVAYTLRGGVLTAVYRAVSDRDTVVNLTNHAYFNLAGHAAGTVAGHVLTLHADRYTPCGAGNVPTGALSPVDGTPLDLRRGAVLGERLADPFLEGAQGYDHNFVLNGGAAAELWCPGTGVALELTTSLPGVQLYTAGSLAPRPGKDGASYGPGCAVCLETQHFPDAVHHENFPSPVLRAGQVYRETTSWRFFIK